MIEKYKVRNQSMISLRKALLTNPEDYLYSSARDYAGTKGLLGIEFMD